MQQITNFSSIEDLGQLVDLVFAESKSCAPIN